MASEQDGVEKKALLQSLEVDAEFFAEGMKSDLSYGSRFLLLR